jgi:predicted exporter
LTDQVRDGAASRLILLGIESAPPPTLAALSKSVAARLRADRAFVEISNGDDASFSGTREFYWRNRYLLSPNVAPERFSVAGLHAALEEDIALLGSNMGLLIKQTLPSDPTRELYALLQRLMGRKGPHLRDGVWFSADARRALLLVHTRAAGFDIDAQQHALALMDGAFRDSRQSIPGAAQARLLKSGPGVFAVMTRDTIERDATWLSVLATIMVVGLLLFAYRSPRVLLLGALPVASGVLVGFAAVSLGFGFVHGITLGFGVTLIGESVDYAVYVFTQTARGHSAVDTLDRIWPTLRLGALTSIVGFSAMLFSDFSGFAQLGLFSIAGLVAAACFTRFVLPHWVPGNFFATGADMLGRPLLLVMRYRSRLRLLIGLLVLAGGIALAAHSGGFWDEELTNLSPIPAEVQSLDRELRRDIGVPDLRYFVVFRAGDEQRALEESQTVSQTLDRLVAQHVLGGFDAPNQVLPSERMQRERRAALPDAATLHANFAEALKGLPFRANSFVPFFREVEAARKAPLLARAGLPPALQLELSSMLFHRSGGWDVIIPLRDVFDSGRVAAEIAKSGPRGVEFVDLDRESDRLLRTFQHEATLLASIGSLAILVLLFVGLRSPGRVLAVTAPLAASVTVTAALLTVGGGKLSIFMIVGFLLIVAVGSNYSLFFERQYHDSENRRRSVASIGLANLCTVSAYGLMALSGIPVLHDIGVTVAVGAFLSLLFSAVLSTRGAADNPVAGDDPGDRAASLREKHDRLPSL